MIPVRCKFKLVGMRSYLSNVYNYETKKGEDKKLVDLEFRVVNPNRDDPSDEKKKSWSSTPSGEIKLATVNQEAIDQFEVGKEYYVTLEEVPGTAPTRKELLSVHVQG